MWVRRDSLAALIHIGGTDAKPYLKAILENPRSPLRDRAAAGLLRAGDKQMVPILKEIHKDGHLYEQDELFAALCSAGDLEAIAELKNRLMESGPRRGFTSWRAYPPRYLGRQQERVRVLKVVTEHLPEKWLLPVIVRTLRRHYGGRYGDYSAWALGMRAIARIADPAAIPVLIDMMPVLPKRRNNVYSDLVSKTKATAAALEQLTGQSFGTDKARWELWWHSTAAEELRKGASGRLERYLPKYSEPAAPGKEVDTDGDGMPDEWELKHGLDPNDASGVNGADGDLDQDGRSNTDEMGVGTQPNDAGSGY